MKPSNRPLAPKSPRATALITVLALMAASCSTDEPRATPGSQEAATNASTDAQAATEAPSPAPALEDLENPAASPAPGPTPASTAQAPMPDAANPAPEGNPEAPAPNIQVATLGAGCFWCIEAVLEQVDGVQSVVSGYMGGQTLNPTYKDICTGTTGHAEVVQVTFDANILPYKDLLDWFWRSHDPTTLNRQGNDRGTQYRSAIFTHTPDQLAIAQTSKKDVQPTFADPIVTQITEAVTFYPGEEYHQGYYFNNTSQGYCRAIIQPKLKKLGLKY